MFGWQRARAGRRARAEAAGRAGIWAKRGKREGAWAGRSLGQGGKRGKGKWAGLVFAGLGLRVWVFLSNFYFFSKSNSNKI